MIKIFLTATLLICCLQFSFGQELIPYEENEKFGFKDSIGNVVIAPKYDRVHDFSQGFAQVNIGGSYFVTEWGYTAFKGGKWGFIDHTGKEITPIKYDDVGEFTGGRARVSLNRKSGYIDTTGKEVVPIIYILEAKDVTKD